MKVSDVADLAGVTSHAVRHYVRVGLITPTQDPRNKYRRFTPRDVRRVLFIKRAQRLGFSIPDIAAILRESERGVTPCPLVRRIIGERIAERDREVEEMLALRSRMKEALARWSRLPDTVPTGDEICALIEQEGLELPTQERAEPCGGPARTPGLRPVRPRPRGRRRSGAA
jgi:DNA-binding transcriptional MerR regulator